MGKEETKTATVNTVPAETAKESDLLLEQLQEEMKTVKAEYEKETNALRAELEQLKKNGLPQNAELTEGQKQALLEREFHLTMEKAKKDTVTITLQLGHDTEDDEVFVSVNGYRYQIQRGVEVEVPRFVAEVLKNSDKQKLEARKRMNELQKKADKEI